MTTTQALDEQITEAVTQNFEGAAARK